MVSPAYSTAWPTMPPVPSRPMVARIRSLAVTPAPSSPEYEIRMVLGRRWTSVCVASTCSTSEVPMPNASAPKAPCVEVWLSPQTIVMPGCESPSSGPITWTMPWWSEPMEWIGTPNSAQLASSASTCSRESSSAISRATVVPSVGTLWSAVAMRLVGPAYRPAGHPQALEGLRRGDLVDQVEVDVDQPVTDRVGLPDLVEHRLCHRSSAPSQSCRDDGNELCLLIALILKVVRQVGVEGHRVPRAEGVLLAVDHERRLAR